MTIFKNLLVIILISIIPISLYSSEKTVYDFTAKSISGEKKSLSDYRGEVLLIVNVASQCGYTKQYTGLRELYKKFRDKGFNVLGFPCNQFGKQEPGSDEEILEFCQTEYNVTFPMFSKIDVNGDNAHILYKYLTGNANEDIGGHVKWNFTKFLIDKNGNVIQRFSTKVEPKDIAPAIEKAINS